MIQDYDESIQILCGQGEDWNAVCELYLEEKSAVIHIWGWKTEQSFTSKIMAKRQ